MANWGSFGQEVKGNAIPNFENQNQNTAAAANDDEALSWEDEVDGEALPDLVTLEPGEYEFTVYSFKRGQYEGGTGKDGRKISPCPLAVYTLEIETPAGRAIVKDTLFLRKSSMWKIAVFFRCIGMGAPEGQPFVPHYEQAVGSSGKVRINNREYNGKVYNNVEKYIEPGK